ncbi:MAG: YlmH/Sll1252 family protein [Oscillospiraceae bacterium]|nr:YlmH/Sll1252 family protein [Oscillospiraceae bacterium]
MNNFLTPAQAAQERNPNLIFDGGFAEAERVVAYTDGPREKHIAAIRLSFRPQDELAHRDILGAVLGLGLDRRVLGDILVQQGDAYLVCLPHVVAFICENLAKAGRIGLRAEQIALDELPTLHKNLREQRGTVASLRLDGMIAEAFNCSRGAAEELLRQGLVRLNHEECCKGTRLVHEGDLIAVRGKGRVKVLEIGGETRKGRTWVVFGVFE